MSYIGDFKTLQTLNFKFTTVDGTGLPTTLLGTPAISVYKNNSITQTTVGVTLTVDFDAVTGLNNVQIALTDAFYTISSDYQVIITAGTVSAISVVGYVIAEFSIENRISVADSSGSVVTDGGNSATSFKTDLTETSTNHWKDSFLKITSGTLNGAVKKVTAYNGTTKIITVNAFPSTPADAVTFEMVNE